MVVGVVMGEMGVGVVMGEMGEMGFGIGDIGGGVGGCDGSEGPCLACSIKLSRAWPTTP